MSLAVRCSWVVVFLLGVSVSSAAAQEVKKPLIPHAQDKPPNEPRDPETAAKMMTVPEGFSVEVVAAEPDIVNPVAMAIDERGRFWITESLEYPRREPGVGKDRVKICEDTDGDGKMDKFSVFLDGLNIPSGIAVGHGGVWIANAPDILFVPDADRDGKPDGPVQVIVTGFGRADTHELPNSLTWGPDGWLYGLNGVFNYSNVTYPKDSPWLKHVAESLRDSDSKTPSTTKTTPNAKPNSEENPSRGATGLRTEFKFTCAMFRIHPRTREFQVFCEGTSNPWGIAFNDEGEAFISACVIDHLWHLVETGYYHRQGGPYPPFTWKIDSIVKHKHQKAAYCGIHYFDSDAYPEQYRGKLYMGNIHGGCINVDRIERDGSTYKGFGEPDFLTANDAWFMPVVQKTGPDGCLYILDWYDRYHCYQDANRDPAGIDRLKGRLYRVRYKDSPRTPKGFDLAMETDEQLIERLGAKNDFIRWTATRLLQERGTANFTPQLFQKLLNTRLQPSVTQSRQAMFVIAAITPNLNEEMFGRFISSLIFLSPSVDELRLRQSWMIRILGDAPKQSQRMAKSFDSMPAKFDVKSASHQEKLQYAIQLNKLPTRSSGVLKGWLTLLAHSDGDKLLPQIIWQNLHPRLEEQADAFVTILSERDFLKSRPVTDLMPRIVDRILGCQKFDAKPVAQLFALLRDDHPQIGKHVLEVISAKVQSGELKGEKLDQLKAEMAPHLTKVFDGPTDAPLYLNAAFLATAFGDKAGFAAARKAVETASLSEDQRLAAVNALVAAKDAEVLDSVTRVLDDLTRRREAAKNADPSSPLRALAPSRETSAFEGQLLAALARLDNPKVGEVVLTRYAKFEPDFQPKAVELLTQRAGWAKQLLAAVGEKKIDASVININQARRLKDLKDDELSKLLATHWGQVREGRDPNREKYIADMKAFIRTTPGDALAGEKAFKKVCAQCHKLYGEGAEVGPDITRNGRNDFTQLLSNVFDPSLVIGAGYRSYTVITNGGRVINGLLAEDSPQRVVLKIQGGKQEVIALADIDEFKVSEISLMPEQLEKQLSQQEIIDLFAFITLDKHPNDPSAKRLPGVSRVSPRASQNPADFAAMVSEILPGFSTSESGELGLGLLTEHLGRDNVLRTHPVSRDKPCVLTMKLTPPADKKTKLILEVAHDARGDWRLLVGGNGQRMADEMISKETCTNGWRTVTVDLSKFAGQELKLVLANQANDWSFEFGYWGGARIVSE